MSQRNKLQTWIYATRPHTLGASIAPMVIVLGALIHEGVFQLDLFALCFIVAVSAQIASNLANDYFDFVGGKDTDHRVGFERILTTGAVTKGQMKTALYITLGICIVAGLAVVALSSFWLLLVGLFVMIGVLAYSAGPYPLSHHGLGDIAVVIFYGLVPVLATFFAVSGLKPPFYLLLLALGLGVWEANILVINNYRDIAEDKENNKRTLVVLLGEKFGPRLYLVNSISTIVFCLAGLWFTHNYIWIAATTFVISVLAILGNKKVRKHYGVELNKVLGFTSAMSMVIALMVMLTLTV